MYYLSLSTIFLWPIVILPIVTSSPSNHWFLSRFVALRLWAEFYSLILFLSCIYSIIFFYFFLVVSLNCDSSPRSLIFLLYRCTRRRSQIESSFLSLALLTSMINASEEYKEELKGDTKNSLISDWSDLSVEIPHSPPLLFTFEIYSISNWVGIVIIIDPLLFPALLTFRFNNKSCKYTHLIKLKVPNTCKLFDE